MSRRNRSVEIKDMIAGLDRCLSNESRLNQVRDILEALNDRMDELEGRERETSRVASCLANGIIPD